MDVTKQSLRGSRSRDCFKSWHKRLDKRFYSTDIDFIWVDKVNGGRIVAFLDYKQMSDKLTFSEVIAYEILKNVAPVLIVEGIYNYSIDFIDELMIFRYIQGDWRPEPPVVKLKALVDHRLSWFEFGLFEKEFRET